MTEKEEQKSELLSIKEGGFDCEFLEPPPEILQTECPVCLQIIREPHQVTCCGYSYCQSCIEQIKADNKPCTKCNSEKFDDFPDKRLRNTLYAFKIRCSHKRDGCKWTGELGQLDEHLDPNPTLEKQLNVCQFVEITCSHCGDRKKRQDLANHGNNCSKRPISCEYCNDYTSHQDNVIHNHWPVCGSFPVRCPNECGSTLQRQNLDSHVAKECPLTTINCDFHHMGGCAVKLSRQNMPEHLRENLITHISLLASSHAKQQDEIKQITQEKKNMKSEIENLSENHRIQEAATNRIKAQCNEISAQNKYIKIDLKSLKEENSKLRQELSLLTNQVRTEVTDVLARASFPLIPSAVLVMTDFQHHKKNSDEWLSPPVYTHHQGYKLRLGVYANGHGVGEGSHVAVSVYIIKGEFDNYLKWPFRGVIWFRLLDQVKGEEHRCGSNTYDEKVSGRLCGRAREGEQLSGLGLNKFIAILKLEPKYLKNDTLHFQIHKMQLS
ncbi:TNF receptor-associated factor 4-like [Halichondria panicea]|uniref:TNF receptor-associated factor 4-like n=1 Tax=Halichondria panicea TaxID=6063 RepID=UPI00312BB796